VARARASESESERERERARERERERDRASDGEARTRDAMMKEVETNDDASKDALKGKRTNGIKTDE